MPDISAGVASEPQADEVSNPTKFTLMLGHATMFQGFLLVATGLLVNCTHLGVAAFTALVFYSCLNNGFADAPYWLITGLVLSLVLRPMAQLLREYTVSLVSGRYKTELRYRLWDSLAVRGPMRLRGVSRGRILSLMSDGVESLEPYLAKYLPQLVVSAITCGAVCAFILKLSVPIAIVLAVCAVATFAIPRIWDRALAEKGQQHWDAYASLNGDFLDSMAGMTTLKSFNAGEERRRILDHKSNELLQKTMKQLRLGLGETGVSTLMALLGPAVALSVGVAQVKQGTLATSDLIVVVLLSREAIRPVQELASCWHAGMFGVSTAASLHEMFHTLQKGSDHSVEACRPSGLKPELDILERLAVATHAGNSRLPGIRLDDVYYRYYGSDRDTLAGISCSFTASVTTAIVGGSGSGKSTLIGLLCGLDDVSSGSILSHEYSMSLVAQEPVIFAGTIAECLQHNKPNAPREDLLTALRVAHFKLSNDSPEQDILEYRLDEGGSNISGGQKQRLAIARALVSKPDTLILDEATSALDSAVEAAVLKSIRDEFPTITMLLVTHRMDVASTCDEVAVLAGGRLVSHGEPQTISAQLLEMNRV